MTKKPAKNRPPWLAPFCAAGLSFGLFGLSFILSQRNSSWRAKIFTYLTDNKPWDWLCGRYIELKDAFDLYWTTRFVKASGVANWICVVVALLAIAGIGGGLAKIFDGIEELFRQLFKAAWNAYKPSEEISLRFEGYKWARAALIANLASLALFWMVLDFFSMLLNFVGLASFLILGLTYRWRLKNWADKHAPQKEKKQEEGGNGLGQAE